MLKSWYIILKGVNCVHNAKIRSYGLERIQLGTQWQNWVKSSWKEWIVYTMQKSGQIVNWVHNEIMSNGPKMSQLGIQW